MPELPPLRTSIKGDATDFVSGIGRASRAVGGFTGLLKGGAIALAAYAGVKGLAGATKEAIKFEQQTAELAKLVSQRQADPLAASIGSLASELPVARDGLFEVAEAAARLGVRGTQNIEQFTRTIAMVGVATDAAEEQAATSMARIAKVTGTPIPMVENLASSINVASNTMAVSFSEVLDASQRAGPGLATLGAKAPEIVALSASVAELSANASRSGTRLNRMASVLLKVDKEPPFAQALGVTVEQFRAMRKENPAQLIVDLAKVMRRGGEGAAIMNAELDETSLRVLRTLAQNADQAQEKLSELNKAYEEGTSIQEEYANFADTVAAKQQVVNNRMDELAANIGSLLLPVMESLLEKTNWVLGKFIELTELMGGADDEVMEPLERVDLALEKLGERSETLGQKQVAGAQANIRDLADEFEDAGNRSAFLSLAFEQIRNASVNTEEDMRSLASGLLTLHDSLMRTEKRFSETDEDIEETGTTAKSASEQLEGAFTRLEDAGFTSAQQVENLRKRAEELRASVPTSEVEELTRQLARMIGVASGSELMFMNLEDSMEGAAEKAKRQQVELAELTVQMPLVAQQTEIATEAVHGYASAAEVTAEINQRMRTGLQQTLHEMALALEEGEFLSRSLERTTRMLADGMVDAFEDIVQGTESVKDAFAQMVSDLLSEISRLLAQQAVRSILGSILGSLGGRVGEVVGTTSAMATGAQAGGPAGPKRPRWVGESGRELFVPRESGRIVPMDEVRSDMRRAGQGRGDEGAGKVVQFNANINVQAMDAEGVDRVLRQKGAPAIRDAVLRAASEDSDFSRALIGGM